MLKEKNYQPRILYPVKLPFKSKREKRLSQTNKISGNLLPVRSVKEVLQREGKSYRSKTQIYIKKRRALEKKYVKIKYNLLHFYS